MNSHRPITRLTCCAVILCLGWVPTADADETADLAAVGYGLLAKYCQQCHGDEFAYPGLDIRDRDSLTSGYRDEPPMLVPGDATGSRLFQRVVDGEMPPEDQPQPTPEERERLRAWIDAGATFPVTHRPDRGFVGEATLLQNIATDLSRLPAADRRHARYFSLAHLWNDASISDEHLRMVRAAVSKLINSLSSQPRIVPPTAIDDDGLILRVDLRDYGWNHRQHWLPLLSRYPYGLVISGEIADAVYAATECDLPYLRADWFVHHASRPPLYHQLVTFPDFVGIPENLATLERLLGVDIRRNFRDGKLVRAAFSGNKSGVSDHNRMVERHDARYGYYWPSYDSAGDSGRQNFFRFPLGPKLNGDDQPAAFDHDGGEMIFSLPNHLQGYMLTTADGARIDVGPQEIVKDPNRFSGGFDIVNGISCFGCHKEGMIPFTDTLRQQYLGRGGEIAKKVLQLYPEQATLDRLVKRDRERFVSALEAATGDFLRSADDTRPATEFPEPITLVAKRYGNSVTLPQVASELGLPRSPEAAQAAGIRANAGELESAIRLSDSLRRLELLPLTAGEPLTRAQWELVFQRTARELRIGLPLTIQ
ncbi:MAG: hypothetical protein EA381_04495 [Planctomycetaceae bacterium]|nr:MAG: hypothetical protein EA381_04495 [Planctomycetaceae bacterium]